MFYVISHANVGANYNTSQNIDSDTIGIYTAPAKHNSSGEDCIKGWCGTTNDIKTTAYGSFESIETAKAWVFEHYDVREVEDGQKPDHDESVMLFKFGKYAPMSLEQIGEAFYEELKSVHWNMTDLELDGIAKNIEEQANTEGCTAIDNLDLEDVRDQRVNEMVDMTGLRFELIEDNAGGLAFFVLGDKNTVVYAHFGIEQDRSNQALMACIGAIKSGISAADIHLKWDGCEEGNLNKLYESYSSEAYVIVADGKEDEVNIYPEKMGASAKRAFDVFEDDETGELFVGMAVQAALGLKGKMAKRSIHLSDKGEAIVAFLSDAKKNGGSNYSGSINTVLELTENLAKTAKPELSEDEWVYLCNIYSGCEISFVTPFNISSDIVGDAFEDERNPKSILLGMLNKSSKWTQCEQFAVLWEVKRRWQEINKKRIRISF